MGWYLLGYAAGTIWRCWRCPASFVHGRLLAGHLIDMHGEGR